MSNDAILAIDPGPEESAYVLLCRDGRVLQKDILTTGGMLWTIREKRRRSVHVIRPSHCVVEQVKCYGMPAGDSLFTTMLNVGRFAQRWLDGGRAPEDLGTTCHLIPRKTVVGRVCGSGRASDANVRRALIDLYGGKETAIGAVKCPHCKGKGWRGRGRPECTECNGGRWKHPPGPLHGLKGDMWAALAVGLAWEEKLLGCEVVRPGASDE